MIGFLPLVCCFFKRPGADRIASVRVHAVKVVIVRVHHLFFWFCVIALQGYFDSSASFFLLPFEGLGVTLIRPCSEWFKTFSVKVNDELVWELGQTCASCSEWSHNNF